MQQILPFETYQTRECLTFPLDKFRTINLMIVADFSLDQLHILIPLSNSTHIFRNGNAAVVVKR